jgi:zinc protease
VFPVSKSLTVKIDTRIPKGLVQLNYPTDDFWDIGRTRRLSVLSAVFSDRLRNVIREELGAAYSPYAYNQPSMAFPGYGVFKAVVTLAPEQVGMVESKVKGIASDLSEKGVGPDELKRALDPILTSIRDMRRTNAYWINSVMTGSSRRPERFDWARTVESDYRSVTAADIKTFAKRYLKESNEATVIVVPEK